MYPPRQKLQYTNDLDDKNTHTPRDSQHSTGNNSETLF